MAHITLISSFKASPRDLLEHNECCLDTLFSSDFIDALVLRQGVKSLWSLHRTMEVITKGADGSRSGEFMVSVKVLSSLAYP